MRRTIVIACLIVGCSSLSGLSGEDETTPPGDAGTDAVDGVAPADGGNANDASDGATSATLDTLASKIADAFCNRSVACRPAYVQSLYGGPQSCSTLTAATTKQDFLAPDAHVLTESEANACAAALSSQSCEEVIDGRRPAACVFQGQVAAGELCVSDHQCQTGFCLEKGPAGCGKCRAVGDVNEDCATTACAPGLSCQSAKCVVPGGLNAMCTTLPCSNLYTCFGGVCTAYAKLTESCSSISCSPYEGIGCRNDSTICGKHAVIQPGTQCAVNNGIATLCTGGVCVPGPAPADGGSPAPPTCTAFAAPGAACGSMPPPCVFGYRCVAGQCVLPNQSFCK